MALIGAHRPAFSAPLTASGSEVVLAHIFCRRREGVMKSKGLQRLAVLSGEKIKRKSWRKYAEAAVCAHVACHRMLGVSA